MSGNVLVETFVAYNQGIWPAQVALLALACALVIVALRAGPASGRLVYAGLAVLWAWCGALFFLVFFTRVWAGAYVGGVLFLLQAVLFAGAWLRPGAGVMAFRGNARGIAGATLVGYALLVYPLLASALGQHYPGQPTFGAPCPLTIFTFGMLLLATGRVPGHLLAIPFIWALMGIVPVVRAGMLEDIGLIAAGLVALPLLLAHNRRLASATTPPPVAGVGETPASMPGTGRLQ